MNAKRGAPYVWLVLLLAFFPGCARFRYAREQKKYAAMLEAVIRESEQSRQSEAEGETLEKKQGISLAFPMKMQPQASSENRVFFSEPAHEDSEPVYMNDSGFGFAHRETPQRKPWWTRIWRAKKTVEREGIQSDSFDAVALPMEERTPVPMGPRTLSVIEDADGAQRAAEKKPSAEDAVSNKRVHIRFHSKEAFNHFAAMWQKRLRLHEDIAVLSRVINEKNEQLETAETMLRDEYGIQPDRQYRYDASQGVIFEVTASLPEEKVRIHRRLSTEMQRQQFVQHIANRDNARVQLQALNMALRDKRASMEALQEQLLSEFAVSRDRDYEVDESTMTLYEFIPIPLFKAAHAQKQ